MSRTNDKDYWTRITMTLKPDDDLIEWIESKQWESDRAKSTTVVRLLRQMKQLERLGKIPEII